MIKKSLGYRSHILFFSVDEKLKYAFTQYKKFYLNSINPCVFRRGPSSRFIPPVRNYDDKEDDEWLGRLY